MNFRTYFKDLIDPTIIVGIIVILIVFTLLTIFFGSKVGDFKQKYKSKYITYLIVLFLGVSLITFIGSSEIFNNQLDNILVFYQTIFFMVGVTHTYLYRVYFNRFDKRSIKQSWVEGLFTLLIFVFNIIPFVLVFTIVKGNTYAYTMAGSTVFFIVPSLIFLTFESTISVPPKIYKTWKFPEDHSFPDPLNSDYRDMLVVTFVFYKNPESDVRTEFRAKAPIRMDFGRLFYHFVNDYNIRNPDDTIKLNDTDGERQHWVFYLKSKYLGFAKFIRPDYPLYMNSIEENSVIICQRTPPLIDAEEGLKYMEKEIEGDEKAKSKKKENKNI